MSKPEPFVEVSGLAAPLLEDNIDTDIIFPARFLLITARQGLGKYAFNDRRFTADGQEVPGFVLNQAPFRDAPILIAGANFGSGSSREQAVWTLLGHGIRCVIASSFGEIFHANCMRNGILPVTLAPETVRELAGVAASGAQFTVSLPDQQVHAEGLPPIGFDLPSDRKLALLNGWDETEQIINQHGPALRAFEAAQRQAQPWLYKEVPAS